MKNIDKLHASIWGELKDLLPNYPLLNHVLKWHSFNSRDKYSHFEIIKNTGTFVIYDSEEGYDLIWDLDKNFLHEQNEELINWLSDLI